METVDTYLDGLANSEDENSKRPTDMINELTGLLHVPIKATTELQRALRDDPRSAAEELHTQIENLLISQTIFRLVGAVERRLEEPLEINPARADDRRLGNPGKQDPHHRRRKVRAAPAALRGRSELQ